VGWTTREATRHQKEIIQLQHVRLLLLRLNSRGARAMSHINTLQAPSKKQARDQRRVTESGNHETSSAVQKSLQAKEKEKANSLGARCLDKHSRCTKYQIASRRDAPFLLYFWNPARRHLLVSSQPPLVCGAALPGPGRGAPSVLGAPPRMCHLLLFLGGLIAGEGLVCSFLLSSAVRVVVLQ
jgi:hypothetical protein